MAQSHKASQDWNKTKRFSSSLWWVPVKSFFWLYGENRWQIITPCNKFGAQDPVLTFGFNEDAAVGEQTRRFSSKSASRRFSMFFQVVGTAGQGDFLRWEAHEGEHLT